MTKVDIGRIVEYKELETALIKAAEDVGWKARVTDEFRTDYKLGSVSEIRKYDGTLVCLRGKIFKALTVSIYNKNLTDSFYIRNLSGFASNKNIKKYLSAVSDNLKK